MRIRLSVWIISLLALAVRAALLAQGVKQDSPLTGRCCENGQAEGAWCDGVAGIKAGGDSCHEVNITPRECVDLTAELMGSYSCSEYFLGARYCSEVDSNGGYPRYYCRRPIVVSPNSLSFTAQYGSSNPPSQAFLILNGVSDVRLLRT